MAYEAEFAATLWRYAGPGGWHFVTVPEADAPSVAYAFGRTPVDAEVDGYAWKTSVWREKSGRTVMAVPKAARGGKGDGDEVRVRLRFAVV
jgi:hypothetical protein